MLSFEILHEISFYCISVHEASSGITKKKKKLNEKLSSQMKIVILLYVCMNMPCSV